MPYIGNIVQDFSVNNAMLNTDSVTSIKIDDGTIVNADINDSAAIAGTKISPDFGTQAISTTGTGSTLGRLTISNVNPFITLTDTNNDSDFSIRGASGNFIIRDDTNGAARLTVGSSGNVGIGTSSPTFSTFGSNTGGIEISDVGSGANALLVQSSSNEFFFANTSSANYIYGADNAPLIISTNGSERMRIKSNGTVGIGTTNPSAKLDVKSTGDNIDEISLIHSGNTVKIASLGQISSHGSLALRTNSGTLTVRLSATTESSYINSGGNFGIGTSSPDQLLHINKSTGTTLFKASVAGNSTIGLEIQKTGSTTQSWRIVDGQTVNGKLEFYDVTDSATRMCIDGSGNVGIGTTSPSNNLEVASADHTGILIQSNRTTATDNIGAVDFRSSSTDVARIQSLVDGTIKFRNTSSLTERMRIDSSGRLLIGTTTPDPFGNRQLTVASSSSTHLEIRSGTSASGLIVFTDGTSGGTDSFKAQIKYNQASDFMSFSTNGANERLRIDSSGRLLVGTSTASTAGNSQYSLFEVSGNTSGTTSAGHLSIKRGEAVASLSNGDTLGRLIFSGLDGGDFAYIQAAVDAAPGSNDYPGRLMVFTGNDGSGSPTERLRIDSSGVVRVGGTASYNASDKLTLVNSGNCSLTIDATSSTESSVFFADGATGTEAYRGYLQYKHSVDGLAIGTSGSEAVRIDSIGRLLMGTTTPEMNENGFNEIVIGGKSEGAAITLKDNNSNVKGGLFSSDSNLAVIVRAITNHPLEFRTNNTQRMRILNTGLVAIGDAISGMDMGFGQQMLNSKSSTHSAAIFGATSDSLTTSIIYNSNTSFGNAVSMCDWRAAASNSSAFYFLRCSTSSASDNEFFLAGDGNAYADGNWNSGGADYAEYFEWSDGNASDEDRRGMTVVLDGTKIKIATSSDSTDNIIGVVSGNPAMVADTAYCKWSGKYQRDDYNAYVRDSEGHRILNSDYDDTKTYLPRKERKEWDAIGMVGKLRIRKGQITGTRWIKMKDISDSVEEWLVR